MAAPGDHLRYSARRTDAENVDTRCRTGSERQISVKMICFLSRNTVFVASRVGHETGYGA